MIPVCVGHTAHGLGTRTTSMPGIGNGSSSFLAPGRGRRASKGRATELGTRIGDKALHTKSIFPKYFEEKTLVP